MTTKRGRPRKPCGASPTLDECRCALCLKREAARRSANRLYRLNGEKVRIRARVSAAKYRAAHAEEIRKNRASQAGSEYHSAYNAAYYRTHTDGFADRRRAWYAANREKAQLQAYNTKLRRLPPELQEMRRLVRDFKRWCIANSDRAAALKAIDGGSAPNAE